MKLNAQRYSRGTFPVAGFGAREASSLLLTETRYASHAALEPHSHELPCIVVLFEGAFTEELAGCTRLCTAPFVLFRPAGEQHADVFGAQGARVLNIEIGQETGPEWGEAPARSSVVGRLAQERLAAELLREFRRMPDEPTRRMSTLVSRTLAASAAVPPLHREPSAPVLRARQLAEQRFREPWALREFARQVGMHPASLARAFRREYGESLGAFVRRVRVREAYRLLAAGSTSAADVAQRTGFFDQAHLTRVFRELVGVNPGEVRGLVRD